MKLNINDWRSNNQSKTLEEIIHLDNLLQEFRSEKLGSPASLGLSGCGLIRSDR